MKLSKPICRLVLYFCLSIFPNLIFAQKIAQFSFEGTLGITSTIDSVSQKQFQISNHFNRPEYISGVKGMALRLDGYSTWAGASPFQLTNIEKSMSIEAWYTTEAFTYENASVVNQFAGNSGFSVDIDRYGKVVFSFYADNTFYTLTTTQSITKYQWNHLVATIDLNSQKAAIYVNGLQLASKTLAGHSSLKLAETTFFLGRNPGNASNSGFLLTVLNGAIDEVSIYNSVLSPEVISGNYTKYSQQIPNLDIDPDVRHQGDDLRPRYHVMPNTSWTNESYGLIYYKGKYHLFNQKNANSPSLFYMHWGHFVSNDLVKWTEEKIALAPSPGFDSFGVWSGTTIKDENGRPVIIYTGVDGAKAGIGVATSTDDNLVSWTKYPSNPIIANPPLTYFHMDFRDPYVWKTGNTYYMIVGSGLKNSQGGILFTYKSTDLTNWQEITPLYRSVNIGESGLFWEMPTFVKLNDTDYMLAVTPIPTSTKPAETIYWIGTWTNEKFTPYNKVPQQFELINNNLLSPSFGLDEFENQTYLAIVPESRSAQDQIAAGWRHTFSLPRVVQKTEGNQIAQFPHPNLVKLRDTNGEVAISNREIVSGMSNNIPEFQGNQAELELTVKADLNSKFTLQVLKNPNGSEFTSILFDLERNVIGLDRRFSTLSNATKDYRESTYIFDPVKAIDIRVFIDHSIAEVFVNRTEAFSFRVYPSLEQSRNVDLTVGKGKAIIQSFRAWKIFDMKLIPELSTASNRLNSDNQKGSISRIYPNPFSLEVNIEYQLKKKSDVRINIYDLSGRKIRFFDLGRQAAGKYLQKWDGSDSLGHKLKKQVYFAEILLDCIPIDCFKLIKI